MQPDSPLRSLIIYWKLGRSMENLYTFQWGKLWNAMKEDLHVKSASRF